MTKTHTHTHTRLTALFPGLPGWAGTRKVKPIWILLKQETASGSGISWAYVSLHLAPDRQPCQHLTTQFLQAGCPSCRPTNSVKALKGNKEVQKRNVTKCTSHSHTQKRHFTVFNQGSFNHKWCICHIASTSFKQ